MLDAFIGYVLFPILYIGASGSQYYWLTYVASAVFGLLLYMLVKRRWFGMRGIMAVLFPKRLVRHASTLLDIKLFFLGAYYLLFQVLLVGGFTFLSLEGTVSALDHIFGARMASHGPSYWITGLSLVLVFLAVEFGYWFSHWLMHRIPALWEFHKVHHSAEVLTPLTEWRQHPLELALFPALVGLASCLVQGPLVWYFGTSSQMINPVTANLISTAFWYTSVHLRHTELPIHAPGLLGRLVQTPGHHQVHHSINPKHFNKNLGYCLSVWDWAFGTLYLPSKDEKLTYGLGHPDSALETAMGSLIAPFGRAFAQVKRSLGKARRQRKIEQDLLTRETADLRLDNRN
jgi:sterol desaturase/sphingolipid hydroxylase (fatty acid hydroxylase superfamily)